MTAPNQQFDERAARGAILDTARKYSVSLQKLAPVRIDAEHYIEQLRLYMADKPNIVKCNPVSIARGLLRVAQTGLDLGVTCDLIPFAGGKNKEVQFVPRYNGLCNLMLAAGTRSINCDVVREGDAFDYRKGTRSFLDHKKGKERGKITDCYIVAELKPDSYFIDVMSRAEVDAVREEFSRSWWWKDPYNHALGTIDLDTIEWYPKKTVLRRASPYLPQNTRLAAALIATTEAVDDADEAEFEVLDDAPPAGEPRALTEGQAPDFVRNAQRQAAEVAR